MRRNGRLDWLLCYGASTLVVFLGVALGRQVVLPEPRHPNPGEPFLGSLCHWDGTYYRDIVRLGYRYDPERQSPLHFFPLYPLVSAAVAALPGVSDELALVGSAHLCL